MLWPNLIRASSSDNTVGQLVLKTQFWETIWSESDLLCSLNAAKELWCDVDLIQFWTEIVSCIGSETSSSRSQEQVQLILNWWMRTCTDNLIQAILKNSIQTFGTVHLKLLFSSVFLLMGNSIGALHINTKGLASSSSKITSLLHRVQLVMIMRAHASPSLNENRGSFHASTSQLVCCV